MEPKWEMDDKGRHRIVCGDRKGPWAIYETIATLDNWFAVSQYYEGTLPTEQVLVWSKING